MEQFEENLNAMWSEINPGHEEMPFEQSSQDTPIPETAILHGRCITGTEHLEGGTFIVSRSDHKLRLVYIIRRKPVMKGKKAKKDVTVICEELISDKGSDNDIYSGAKILNLSFSDGIATVEVLTQRGEQLRSIRASEEKGKRNTIRLVRVMLNNVDKGVSGFWTDDYEGCGNPDIFPEFEEGLKHGKYVHKDHGICPWNKAVMYGDGNGNIHTGCYYSCSIDDARFLSPDMVRDVLTRFLERYEGGEYDGVKAYDSKKRILPLLNDKEILFIRAQRCKAEEALEKQWEKKKQDRLSKAAKLIARHPDDEYWKELLSESYGENHVCQCRYGTMIFSPDALAEVETNGTNLSYDDFLDLQRKGVNRHSLESVFFDIGYGSFMGQITKKSKTKVCFSRIYVDTKFLLDIYYNPYGGFGKEDHVWMDISGFEEFNVGDSVRFSADVYMYLKTGNGRRLEYGIRNPGGIKQIDEYDLPSDEDMVMQAVDKIVCETCMFTEHCNRMMCLANKDERNARRETFYNAIKNNDSEQDTT